MTNAEAIAKFKDIMRAEIDRMPSHYDAEAEGDVYSDIDKIDDILKLNKVVCKALEKQIPKKPIKSDREIRYCEVWKCPSCGFEWSSRVVDFCYNCGQCIDWSEED